MTLTDKIVVLRDGRIEQVGTPRELYERPQTIFVAQFIGSPKMNVVPPSSIVAPPPSMAAEPAAADRVGVRPEHLTVVAPDQGMLLGSVVISECTGAMSLLHVELDSGEPCLVVHDGSTPDTVAPVGLRAEPDQLHCFEAGGAAIRKTALH